jgi:hypothetical protein
MSEESDLSHSRRRLKNLLRQYYNSKELQEHPFNYNSSTFKVEAYFTQLLQDKNLHEFIQLNTNLTSGETVFLSPLSYEVVRLLFFFFRYS